MTNPKPTGGSDKISISFPPGTRAVLQAVVAAGGAQSVSAFVADAVAQRLQREAFIKKIMELRDDQPLDPAGIDWACELLGATPEQAAAVHARFGPSSSTGQVAS